MSAANKYYCLIEDGPDRDSLLEAFIKAREKEIDASATNFFTIIQEERVDNLGNRSYHPVNVRYVRVKTLSHDDSDKEYQEYSDDYDRDKEYDQNNFIIAGRMQVCFNPRNNSDDKYEKSRFSASYNAQTRKGRIVIETYS